MFMDISSEMIHSLLPLFLVGTLAKNAPIPFAGKISGD
jgi:hypothetical protein